MTMPFDRRRALTYGLGLLWIFDALLKIQPDMFHALLIANVLAPAATDSQPPWLFHIMTQGARLWISLGMLSNVLLFIIEALIGLLILKGPDSRAGRLGLWLSLFWGAVVWIFAEGLGGLVSGSPSFIQGSPGSIPFYAMAAMLLLQRKDWWTEQRIYNVARYGLAIFWFITFLWEVLPSSGFWTPQGLAAQFGDITMNGNEPTLLQMAINAMVITSQLHPVLENAIYSAILLILALLSLFRPKSRWTWLLTGAWLFFIWAIPQAFGTLFSGTGTDPGMILPFALLIWTLLGSQFPFMRQNLTHSKQAS
ncbi:MAG: hypothetical protein C7B47_09270 [Sulfobacillus thermosulfidooxidans]|uniref:Uncharacterized protein n=1 Tax=Sulfobacillus thermosulfidooxidans TaxID=28034 RepID=A0A2T2WXX3_SULTH|nr:MAG: hypothetical protein C7B47_09270 [Sulfobacillus thermosulfidooxidans]